MNRNLILESLNYIINEIEVRSILNKNTFTKDEYKKFKDAHELLSKKNKYSIEVCLDALNIYKKHLETLIKTDLNFKDLESDLLDEVSNIQKQINILSKNDTYYLEKSGG